MSLGVASFNGLNEVEDNNEQHVVYASEGGTYTVQKGDNLYRIALNNNMSLDNLLSINGLSEKSIIHPGDILKLDNSSSSSQTNNKPTVNRGGYWNGMTQEQYNVLLAVIQQESGIHREGAFAVSNVITNRIDHGFASNPYKVVTQRGQFESYHAGHYKKHLGNIHPVVKAQVDRALNGEKSHNYLFFWSAWYAKQQGRSGENIGGNVFFRNY